MNIHRKKVAFHTLGCKLNFTETSAISRLFPEDQFERVPADTKADIYIINTCSVTDTADRKSRQAIKKFINQSPEAFIVAVGCYAQLKPLEISAIPGVDLVLGTNEKFNINYYLSDFTKKPSAEIHACALSPDDIFYPSFSMGERTRSFLKVQDGCDYRCTYCTIPLARGRSRNPEISTLVAEAEKITATGVKEIVLTGVNSGDFGKSTGETFNALLKELVKVQGIERIRISSVEPNLLTDELIETISGNEKILPHFHIPLQSGCDKMLALMRRRYTRDTFEGRIKRIRDKLPLAGIGIDVIAGFPGESASDFEETYYFLDNMPLSYLHVFTFSARPGTPAEKMPHRVNSTEAEKRSKRLIALSQNKQFTFNKMNIGRISDVLFEHSVVEGLITGFTPNYIRVGYPWQTSLAGRIQKVKLIEILQTGIMSVELVD